MHLRHLNCVSATFTYSTYINNYTFELTCSTICCCRLPLLLQSLRFFRPHLLHFITTETYFIERRQDLAISLNSQEKSDFEVSTWCILITLYTSHVLHD